MRLNQCCVPFICCREQLGGQSVDRHDVGGFVTTRKEKASGMVQCDEDGRGRSLVALRKMVGELVEEKEFICYLVEINSILLLSREHTHDDIGLDLDCNDRFSGHLLSWRQFVVPFAKYVIVILVSLLARFHFLGSPRGRVSQSVGRSSPVHGVGHQEVLRGILRDHHGSG